MKDKIVRCIIEFDIDSESLYEHGLNVEDILRGIVLRESDIIDGFELTTNIPGHSPVTDFFLCNGRIVDKRFL